MAINSILFRVHKKEESPAPVKPAAEKEVVEAVSTPPEPSNPPAVSVLQRVQAKEEKEVITEVEIPAEEKPLNFKDRLAELDRLVSSELGINSFTMDAVRGHVKQIMIDLKEQPELDSCLIDRDVHNILAFIRTVKDSTIVETVEKKEKQAKAAAKKKAKGGVGSGFSLDPSSFANFNLKDLGNLKT